MKQHINLYQDVLKPVPQQFTLLGLTRMTTVLGIILVSLAVLLKWQLSQQELLNQRQQQHVALKVQELDKLQQAFASRQPDSALQQQLQHVRLLNQQKQQLTQVLSAAARQPQPQYSLLFTHLDAIDPAGFWLTEFELSPQLIQFQGVSKSAQTVPLWLKNLGKAASMQSQSFSSVVVDEKENGYLQFRIVGQTAMVDAAGARE